MDAISCVAPPAFLSRSFSLSDPPVTEPFMATADLGACAAATTAPSAACVPAVALHTAGGGPPRTAPSSARCRLGQAGGRAGKRRPRPSKRAPTTYISTDAATFRLMGQHVTGAQAEPQDVDAGLDLLPPFEVEPLLPADAATPSAAHVAAYIPTPPEAAVAEQPCFPTLDSWNVMYGKNEVV